MQVTSRADYALRAVIEIARSEGAVTTRDRIAEEQDIPAKFLEAILGQLSRSGLLVSKRGSGGGYVLARSADEISVADVLRAVDGPLAGVRGESPEDVGYPESSETLRQVWIAVRVSLRQVLENTTIQDIARKTLPSAVRDLLAIPGAWERR